jgi:hypothetical protein
MNQVNTGNGYRENPHVCHAALLPGARPRPASQWIVISIYKDSVRMEVR